MSRWLLPVWSTLVFVFLFLPIIVIIVYSFNVGRLLVSWDHFGFDSFAAIVTKLAKDRGLVAADVAVDLESHARA